MARHLIICQCLHFRLLLQSVILAAVVSYAYLNVPFSLLDFVHRGLIYLHVRSLFLSSFTCSSECPYSCSHSTLLFLSGVGFLIDYHPDSHRQPHLVFFVVIVVLSMSSGKNKCAKVSLLLHHWCHGKSEYKGNVMLSLLLSSLSLLHC